HLVVSKARALAKDESSPVQDEVEYLALRLDGYLHLRRLGSEHPGSRTDCRRQRHGELGFEDDLHHTERGPAQRERVARARREETSRAAKQPTSESSLSAKATAEPVRLRGMGSSRPTGR